MKKPRPNQIRRIRRNLDLSQTELARLLNTYQRQISRWETGERKVPEAKKEEISRVLGFNVESIFTYIMPKESPSTSPVGRTRKPQGGR